MNTFDRLLLFCAGSKAEVLARCPGSVANICRLNGLAILLSAAFALVGGIYAFISICGIEKIEHIADWLQVFLAVVLGSLFALMILVLDILLLASLKHGSSIAAILRVIISGLIAWVISMPLKVSLFRQEIDQVQMTQRMQLEEASRNRAAMLAGTVAKNDQLVAYEKRAELLANRRTSEPESALYQQARTAAAGLQTRIPQLQDSLRQTGSQVTALLSQPGIPPAAHQIQLEQLKAIQIDLRQQIATAHTQLARYEKLMQTQLQNYQASLAADYEEHKKALQTARQELALAEREVRQKSGEDQAAIAALYRGGFIQKVVILSEIAGQKSIYAVILYAITGLFCGIELLPILAKLLARLEVYGAAEEAVNYEWTDRLNHSANGRVLLNRQIIDGQFRLAGDHLASLEQAHTGPMEASRYYQAVESLRKLQQSLDSV